MELELTCHHEAGHAAVAHYFGLRLHVVWVNPVVDDGRTILRLDQQQTRLQHALILAASICAERIVDPQRAYLRMSTLADEGQLETVISQKITARLFHRPLEYVEGIRASTRNRIIACSRRLVVKRWPGVERLAKELQARHRIEGPKAEEILSA